ncbi:helix-turn-helix domain-containing protein [Paenibacillus solisilvae]|uniref:Helix-turn-helix domain-containing protein n=1 Tax=Paenibacillus solisilvae TaxID=2486751 RepID=A0ABW0W0C3_9BACL
MKQSLLKRFRINWSDTRNRLVLILTASVSIIILAVGITSYYTSKSVLQRELSEPQHQILQIGMNTIDNYIRESDKIAVKLALHSNVYKFLTMREQNSYTNISVLDDFLGTLVQNTSYIRSIYIYDINRGSFITYPFGYSSRALTFGDSGWVNVVDRFGDKAMIVERRDLPAGFNQGGAGTTLFRKIIIQGDLKGIIAINFIGEKLFGQTSSSYVSNLDSMRFIIDQKAGREDQLVYAVGADNEDFDAMKGGLAGLGDKKFTDFVHEGRHMLVSQIRSPVTGWKYVSAVSQEKLLDKSKTVRNSVLSVSIFALVLGGLTIFYFNYLAFRPVRRMLSLFSNYDRARISPDLIDLEKFTNHLMSDHTKLSQLIRQTMPDASSKFLLDVCHANIRGSRDITAKWNSYFPKWSNAQLTVAVVSIDGYPDWSARFTETDHSLLKFALANIVTEMMSAEWRAVCADFGKDKTAILLQPLTPEAQQPDAKLAEAVPIVRRLLKFSVSVGISTPHADASKLKQAVFEAENALSYRLYEGEGCVIPYRDVSDHEMPEAQSWESFLMDLTHAVEAGDKERSLHVLAELLSEIERDYWYPSKALSLLNQIESRLIRIARCKEADVWNEPNLRHTYDLESIGRHLSDSVSKLAERFGKLAQSKEFIMCQQMIDYMKRHLKEPVGVQEVADSTGISVSLAIQVFKQETNETIYGYLTNLRVERAGELLLQTDHKISDIALMVGYQHENSFIRVFRKYKDITPGKYRELMKDRNAALLE